MGTRRQPGEGSVYRRPSRGQWVAVADLGMVGGKRDRREFTAPTSKGARAKRDAFLASRRDGFTMPKGRPPTVAEWLVAHWLPNVAARRVEGTTFDGYSSKVLLMIVPYLGHIPLPELTEEDLEDWHRRLESSVSAKTHRPPSASSIAQAHRILSSALKVAVARGKMPRNPAANVSPPRVAEPESDPPPAADVRRVLARCRSWPAGARWVLAITTGLRQGEALGLQWPDLTLDGVPSVAVRRAAARVRGRGRVIKAPKSAGSARTVPLSPTAVRALRELRDARPVRPLRDDWVFVTKHGKPVHPTVDYRDWQALLADLGLPPYRVHDLRHAYATMLLEEGIDPRVVQAMLGHSTMVLLKKYQHVRAVMHTEVAAAIERATGGG